MSFLSVCPRPLNYPRNLILNYRSQEKERYGGRKILHIKDLAVSASWGKGVGTTSYPNTKACNKNKFTAMTTTTATWVKPQNLHRCSLCARNIGTCSALLLKSRGRICILGWGGVDAELWIQHLSTAGMKRAVDSTRDWTGGSWFPVRHFMPHACCLYQTECMAFTVRK